MFELNFKFVLLGLCLVYVMLSEAKHLYCAREDTSVAWERSFRVT